MFVKWPPFIIKPEDLVKNDMRVVTGNLKKTLAIKHDARTWR